MGLRAMMEETANECIAHAARAKTLHAMANVYVRELIDEIGLSYSEIARRVDVTASYISRVHAGKQQVSILVFGELWKVKAREP